MKKILLSIFTLSIFGISSSFAQCTPDTTITDLISYPTEATISNDTVFLPELIDFDYSATIFVAVPDSAEASGISGAVNFFQLNNLTGLPDGLSYECDNDTCYWAGGDFGCVTISGTISDTTEASLQYELELVLSAEVNISGVDFPIDSATIQTLVGETTIILATAANLSIEEEAFNTVALYPNPSSTVSTMRFNALTAENVNLSVTDMSGRVLYTISMESTVGENTIEIPASSFSAGLYQVRLSNGDFAVQSQLMIRK